MDKSFLPFIIYPVLIIITLLAGWLGILPSNIVIGTFTLLIGSLGGLLIPSPLQQKSTSEGGTKSNV